MFVNKKKFFFEIMRNNGIQHLKGFITTHIYCTHDISLKLFLLFFSYPDLLVLFPNYSVSIYT